MSLFPDPFHPFENPIWFIIFLWLTDQQKKNSEVYSVSFEWDKDYMLNFLLKMKEKGVINEEIYMKKLEEMENLWKN
jgi:hypothetical protein